MKNRLLKRQYAVAVAKRQNGKDFTELKYHVLKNGMNFWVADPFPIEVEGFLYIFGEVFEYTKNKGSIGYTKLVNGKFSPWKIVIEEDYHLSFPNIWNENGKFFMCPEANESNTIYLYRCESFPDKWIKDRVIIDGGNYVDTVYYENNREKYGITYDIKKGNELRLFDYKKGIISHETVENAKSDYSRPAGKIFFDDISGKKVLPTQIGIPTYGAGMLLNEFEVNWPNMTIIPWKKIYANDFILDKKRDYSGVHTLNFTDKYVVIDLKWYGFNAVNVFYKIIRRINGTAVNTR